MKLGMLIKKLEQQPKTNPVFFDFGYLVPDGFASWRGDYSMLALDFKEIKSFDEDITIVEELLEQCKDVIGKTLAGYKGGEFEMSEYTKVWVSHWEEDSPIFISDVIEDNGVTIIETKYNYF